MIPIGTITITSGNAGIHAKTISDIENAIKNIFRENVFSLIEKPAANENTMASIIGIIKSMSDDNSILTFVYVDANTYDSNHSDG